jgi:hypothetical protein
MPFLFSLGSNNKPLARVFEKHLCQLWRFRIQLDSTLTNRDSGIVRQSVTANNHQLGSVIGSQKEPKFHCN